MNYLSHFNNELDATYTWNLPPPYILGDDYKFWYVEYGKAFLHSADVVTSTTTSKYLA